VKVPEDNINGTSFLNLALCHRNLSAAKELLSFWSPEKHSDDPLLPLAAHALLATSGDATTAEDVEFFRLLFDHGLDLNCDTSPQSPLARLGFDMSLVNLVASNCNIWTRMGWRRRS